jgi:hypothetical protein
MKFKHRPITLRVSSEMARAVNWLCYIVHYYIYFYDVRFQVLTAASMMMEAARTSETSVDNYFIRQYIPEDF